MMRRTGCHIVVWLLITLLRTVVCDWYNGCYMYRQWGGMFGGTPQQNYSTPVACLKHCLDDRYSYAGVALLQGESHQCWCYDYIYQLSPLENGCTQSCHGDLDIPCGESQTSVAIYTSEGPYLVDVTMVTDDITLVNHEVVFEVIGHFAVDFENYTTGIAETPIEKFADVQFNWQIDGDVEQENATVENNVARVTLRRTFSEPAIYPINVTVASILTSVSKEFQHEVVLPYPTNLEVAVTTSNQNNEDLPSCIPQSISKSYANEELFALFVDVPMIFVASLQFGENVTYSWEFTDDRTKITSEPYLRHLDCENNRECLIDSQLHTFNETGVFAVHVNVTNHLGSLVHTINVVVMHREIRKLNITFSPKSSNLTTPGEITYFDISMVTTSRKDSLLDVQFGDGTKATFVLRDQNGTLLGMQYPSPGHEIFLVASYGEGCTLKVEIEHTYTIPGQYVPDIKVHNNFTEAQASLLRPLIVMNRIRGIRVTSPWHAATESTVMFDASFVTRSDNVTFHWSVKQQNLTLGEKFVSYSNLFYHSFPDPGVYVVHLRAENILNWEETDITIHIQEPITGLFITSSHEKYIATDVEALFRVDLATGSNVEYIWDFSDPLSKDTHIVHGNNFSIANHTFIKPGKYNVTVTCHNMLDYVSQSFPHLFSVQEVVSTVLVTTDGPTLLGEFSAVSAMVASGTDVQFDMDFGTGRKKVLSDVVNLSVTVTHKFPSPGTHSVTIYAYNNVSAISTTTDVQVQRQIDDVTIEFVGDTVKDANVTFILRTGGVIQIDESLMLTWLAESDPPHVTKLPIFTHAFSSLGKHIVNVTVENLVSYKQVSVEVDVTSAALLGVEATSPRSTCPVLNHPRILKLGSQCVFTLQNFQRQDTIYVVSNYGDGNTESKQFNTEQDISWEYLYQEAGLFPVSINMSTHGENTRCVLESMLVIQESIAGLVIEGPSAVPVGSESKHDSWQSTYTSGSHVIYRWNFDDNTSLLTPANKVQHKFSIPENVNVTVEAINDVSKAMAFHPVFVQHPISHVTITAPPVILHSTSRITVDITGDRPFSATLDFGDGVDVQLTSEDSDIGLQIVPQVREGLVPVYRFTKQHLYGGVGSYFIRTNVSNQVDWYIQSKNTTVEEPISGIVLTTEDDPLVMIGNSVTVTATVQNGNNLEFVWNFHDQYSVTTVNQIDSQTSQATHTFNVANWYTVSVEVKNYLYSQPISAELPFKFIVAEPVKNIDIIHLYGSNFSPLKMENGNWTTDKLFFKVTCWEGSDVYFDVHYGDGTVQSLLSSQTLYGGREAISNHYYKTEGVFTIRLIARNQLGNVTVVMKKPFIVQKPPTGIQLNKREYHSRLSNITVFSASLKYGTNVSYDWDFGDQTQLKNEGSEVSHRYITSGRHAVTVKAHNKVAEATQTAYVYVWKPIQGVDISLAGTTYRAKQTSMEFTATPHPHDLQIVRYYNWDFGDSSARKTTIAGKINYSYGKVGTYIVRVEAENGISRMISAPFEVNIFATISKVEIRYNTDPLIGRPMNITATHFQGNNVTYTWDFGNGEVKNTSIMQIQHTFRSKGAYIIKVRARNLLNEQTAEKRVFVLERYCRPPEIEILGGEDRKIYRSDTLKVEATVDVNCSITNTTRYQWRILNETTQTELDLAEYAKELELDRILILPPRSLPYGIYTIQLKVAMSNTIVWEMAKSSIEIIPTPLYSVIKGGVMRYVGPNDTIHLDGRESSDLDYPEDSSMSYEWSCYELNNAALGCLDGENGTFISNQSNLNIAANAVIPNLAMQYVFNLTIMKPGIGGHPPRYSTTTQVVQIDKRKNLDVSVKCAVCDDGVINSEERVILEANCDDCNDDNVTYSWRMFLVADELTISGANDDFCVKADGSSYQQFMLLMAEIEANKTASGSTTTVPTTKTTTVSTTSSTTTTHRSDTGGEIFNPPFGGIPQGPPGIPVGSIGEGGVEEEEGRGKRSIMIHDPTSALKRRKRQSEFPPWQPPNIGEGIGSGGIAEGPSDGGGRGGGGSGTDNTIATTEAPGDEIVDTINTPRVDPHVMTKDNYPITLRPEQTVTGVNNKILVLNTGELKQNKTHILELTITKGELQGKAKTYFKVNPSPYWGQCVIEPIEGIELDTQFHITCNEWKDENVPLTYEVSYSLSENKAKDLVYQGLNSRIHFPLPAGLPERDHNEEIDVIYPKDGFISTNIQWYNQPMGSTTIMVPSQKQYVLVYISVVDSLRARTELCAFEIRVTPKDLQEGHTTAEEILLGYVEGTQKVAEFSINATAHKKDSSQTRNQVRLVATRLNRLDDVQGNTSKMETRRKIRKMLVDYIDELPIRDEYEVVQSLSVLKWSTQKPEELTQKAQYVSTSILDKAVTESERLSNSTQKSVSSDVFKLGIDAISNIIGASILMEETEFQHNMAKSVVTKSVDVMNRIVKNEIHNQVMGEGPIEASTKHLSIYAHRHKSSFTQNLTSHEGAQFFIPPTLDAIITSHNLTKAKKENCFQTHMTSFKRNPYIYHDMGFEPIQSQVAALNIYDCEGAEINVKDLPKQDEIGLMIPRTYHQVEQLSNYTLQRDTMNLHQFYVTDMNTSKSIHVLIELNEVKVGRTFPISILISYNKEPTPTSYMMRYDFSRLDDKLELFLPSNSLPETGTYYLAVVDSSYNSGQKRPGEVHKRTYSLKFWLGNCMFWDDGKTKWSTDGCTIHSTSTYFHTKCSCNHLTSFGAHFSLVPNTLGHRNVEDFFSISDNPVMFSLIICISIVYIILLYICWRADKHDEKKGNIVFLVDNDSQHTQRYEITFETGFRRAAGTTAKVSLVLHGEEGMSETRELVSDQGQSLFERNSRDTFIMSLNESIGRIWKVQIWHNNTGVSPSWYLSRVCVKDCKSGNIYYFQCEKWFAVEEDDGKVEREVMVMEGTLSFQKIFWSKGTQYFADFHLWTSLFTRPSPCRFKRTERLTCCLTLLMSYIVLNAMWYKQQEDVYRGEFGLLDVSWRAVVVGIITSLIILPVYGLIVLMFRRSRMRRSAKKNSEKDYKSGKPDDQHSESDIQSHVEPIMTYSILDQSLMNLQNLQEWAQKQWAKRYQNSAMSSSESVKPQRSDIHPKLEEADQTSSGFEDNTHNSTQQLVKKNVCTHKLKKLFTSNSGTIAESPVKNSTDRVGCQIFLPFWCRYVAWCLCFMICVACATVTILYGCKFGRTKSIMWLQSLYFSVVQCIFISHPLLIILAAVYTGLRYRNNYSVFNHYNDGYLEERLEMAERERRNKVQYDQNYEEDELARGIAARQRSRYLRFARPPQEKQLIEARKKTLKEKKAYSIIKDCVGFGCMVVLLFFIAFGKCNDMTFKLNKAVKNAFIYEGHPSFSELTTEAEWWTWARTSLLDSVYWESWYNGNTAPRGHIMNGAAAIIGTVNIRQLRVQEMACNIPEPFSKTNSCRPHYFYNDRSTDTYGDNWQFSSDNERSDIWGRHGTYDGSGYNVVLKPTRMEAFKQLQRLFDNSWIDKKTRAVVVEFTLFNAPTNLFTSVHLVLETPPMGGATSMAHINSVYLYRYVTSFDNFILACELLFVIIILFKVRHEICGVIKRHTKYFRKPWNILEVCMLFISVIYILCYIYRYVLIAETVEMLRATYHEHYVDMAYIAYWDDILKALVGLILFIEMVKGLQLLRYSKRFAMFGNVYRRAYMELFIFLVMFVILVGAYSSLGVALYSASSYDFQHPGFAAQAMVGLMTRIYSFADIERFYNVGARLFIVSFLMFALGMLTSYIVASLSYHFKHYKQEETFSMSVTETLNFYMKKMKSLIRMQRVYEYDSDGEDEDENALPPEFTMAEIEYQVDELLFKMNELTGLCNLPDKPVYDFTDSDCTFAAGDELSSGGSDGHPGFNDERFEQRIHKIQDNMYSCEPQLAHLLGLDPHKRPTLGNEKEKQLRSQLELEIFRQLQMQRHPQRSEVETSSGGVMSGSEPGAPSSGNSSPAANPCVPENANHTESANLKRLGYIHPLSANPNITMMSGRRLFPRPPDKLGVLSGSNQVSPKQKDKRLKGLEILNPQDLQSNIPDIEKQVLALLQKETLAPVSAESGARPKTKSQNKYNSIEMHALGNSPQSSQNSAQLKEDFKQSSLQDLPPIETTKTSIIGSPGQVVRGQSYSTVEPIADYGYLYDTSSSSEIDSTKCKSGKRSLRKTKSRGKGKGLSRLTPVEGMESGAVNHGYATDSDNEEEIEIDDLTTPSGRGSLFREAWA
ncbi:unnamed protein product [Owenia fusiformis]|uniref:Uncharacterized protein n=1 Tax=Owenia fusiformis TaxID=6347 RepID=A0A8S4P489_OWEFU|nr:unnamed protein product [Owenia fusiformis]